MNTEKRTMGFAKETHPVYSKLKLAMLQILLDVAIISHFFQAIIQILFEFVVPFPKHLQMPSDHEETANIKKEEEENIKVECGGLFPTITKTSLSGKIDEKSIPGNPQPCSTGLTTRLLPFKNERGEIEWTFTDDIVLGTELDCFKMTPTVVDRKIPVSSQDEHMYDHGHEYHIKQENTLSPMSSNSSNNESILSNEKNKKKDKEETPMTANSSPYLSSDHDEYKVKSEEDGETKTYNCPHCNAVFKIRGYLTRHIKKHAINKAYSCPFHKFSIYIDENNITHKCHPTGGFSRRDTYKTHLKARHFKYPHGTKTKDRSNTPGNCSMCGEHFQNSEIWCEIHIEGAECKFLPAGFKGKSIIKNRLKKQLTKQRSKKLGESVDSCSLFETPSSNSSKTPIPLDSNSMSYEYNNSNSPSNSTSSGNTNNANLATNVVTPDTNDQNGSTPIYCNQLFQLPTRKTQQKLQQHQQDEKHQDQQPRQQNQELQHRQQHPYEQDEQQPDYLMFEQFKPHKNVFQESQLMYEDYDDEFCLDVDQLNKTGFNNYNEILSYLPQNSGQPYQQHVHY